MTVHATPVQRSVDLELLHGVAGRRPRLQPWIVFALAVVAAFFALIYSRISLDNSAFELDELADRIVEEEARHWDLRLEVARKQDPERISRLAEGMGLIYPAKRVSLEVNGIDDEGLDSEYRWAQLKTVLSAQP